MQANISSRIGYDNVPPKVEVKMLAFGRSRVLVPSWRPVVIEYEFSCSSSVPPVKNWDSTLNYPRPLPYTFFPIIYISSVLHKLCSWKMSLNKPRINKRLKSPSFWLWRRVVMWQVGILQQHYMTSQPKRPQLDTSSPWRPQISQHSTVATVHVQFFPAWEVTCHVCNN
jgi:hypothetical protein